ncbi:hypothetical protein [Rhizobium leguminosarum]|uniref:hypothetical protein n=1 Tax=Rhizobium leguminosarum TaxID=384 RepID=UPI0014421B80|nr:hypothetical protein [Rhizobium leguminosarum]NKJ77768.1 hypothetical protein [Rhizobium leguminosarum bv. viciae]
MAATTTRIIARETRDAELPKGIVHRFALTAVQDHTDLNVGFHKALKTWETSTGGELYHFPITDSPKLLEFDGDIRPYFHEDVRETLIYKHRVRLVPDLLVLTDAGVNPASSKPLQSFLTANVGRSVIIPAVQIALESLPRMFTADPAFAMTTGCCTVPNYKSGPAGKAASLNHQYGALIVEIDSDGAIFPRHVQPDETGAFQDLDRVYLSNGEVRDKERVWGISWGDLQHAFADEAIYTASFGWSPKQRRKVTDDNILDALRPYYSFLEDTNEFRLRGHHNIKDPHFRTSVLQEGTVEDEIAAAVAFVNALDRPLTETIVKESNHDLFLARWLKSPEGRIDPENAAYWHELNGVLHRSLGGKHPINIVEHAMRRAGLSDTVVYLPCGESYVVGDVENGLHGHQGLNGSNGTTTTFSKIGFKTNTGHGHAPTISGGSYRSGASCVRDRGFNVGGLTTEAPGHIVHYMTGGRALLLLQPDGRHRACGELACRSGNPRLAA